MVFGFVCLFIFFFEGGGGGFRTEGCSQYCINLRGARKISVAFFFHFLCSSEQ